MTRVDITYPGDIITRSITALVKQPVSPASAPPIDIGLVQISTPSEQIPGPPGPPGPGVVIHDAPPANPVDGTLWWESDTGILWAWYIDADSAQWVQISGGTGSKSSVIIADTAPEDAENGQLWWNSSNGNLYCWYDDGDSGQWVQVNTNGGAPLTPQMFGAVGDSVTDDKLAMQAFIDACEASGTLGFIPAGQYRITGALYAGRTSSLRIMGICKTQNAALDQSSTLVFDVADNTHGLIVGATAAARRDGVEIDGLMIHRATQEPKAGTGVGITYRGVIQGTFRNITVRNFATGGYLTENGGVCSGCTFDTVRYENSTKIGLLLDCCIENEFRHGKIGAATGADANLKFQDSASGGPGGNYFRNITIIADDFAPNGADYNLLDLSTAGWSTFTECAFENANIQHIRAVGGGTFSQINLTIDNCWFNSCPGTTIYAEDAYIHVHGSRLYNASLTSAAIYLKLVNASANNSYSLIHDNYITYKTVAGVVIDNMNGVKVSHNHMDDTSVGLVLPGVSISGANAQYCAVLGNRIRTSHATGLVMGSATNIARDNLLYTAQAADFGQKTFGGPTQTVGGGVPIFQLLGVGGNDPSILQAAYRNNAGAPQFRSYKSRGTTVGARGTVAVSDELYHHYVFADDGSADIEAANMTVFVEAVSAGIVSASWNWGTKTAAGAYSTRLKIAGTGNIGIGESTPNQKLDVNGSLGIRPGASVTPVNNGEVIFQLTSNTQLTIKAKGSDAVIRTANITLA